MGYPDWDRSRGGRERQAPETGRWDPRQERWIPQQRVPEDDDHGVDPYRRPGQGRVLDHDEWSGRRPRRRLPLPMPEPEDRDDDGDEDDDEEYEDEPDQRKVYIGSYVSTACWYLIPFAAYAGWSLTLPDDPRPGCINAFGMPCPSAHDEAMTNIGHLVPQLAVAMAVSIVIAMLLGRVTTGWRPFAIGFASAVLGAGVATIGFAVLATQHFAL